MKRINYRPFLTGSALLAVLAYSAVHPAPTVVGSAADDKSACLKQLAATGYQHRRKMVANLNAVRNWTMKAQEKGEAYRMWQYARGGQVACERRWGSLSYRCTAIGQPCLPRQAKLGSAAH